MIKGLIIVETPLLTALAWMLTHNWILCSVIFLGGLILFIILGPENIKEHFLKCRKCGNEQITNKDVLNYSKKKNVRDIPKELCIIKYKHTIAPLM